MNRILNIMFVGYRYPVSYVAKRFVLKTFLFLIAMLSETTVIPCKSQALTDSLVSDFNSAVAKNFSRYRTVNLYWEMNGNHNYTFAKGGKEMEKSRKENLHTIRFSTMIPVVKINYLSLYANLQYSNYNFRLSENDLSNVFLVNDHSYYKGGVSASYFVNLFNIPLLLSADVLVDGWNKGWGKVRGRFVAALIIKKGHNTGFSAGLMGMTLGEIPVMPVLSYWHRFSNPDWSIDISVPSQLYLRYQMKRQRFSIGGSMVSDNFYLRTNMKELPSVCYYSEVAMRPELMYEYIINKDFFLTAKAGFSIPLKSGLYTKSRKEIELSGETFEQERSLIPFFNVGISYSLFK